MKRDQFTFYRSYYEALKSLPQKEQVKVYSAICAYALDEKEPSLTGIALSVFTLIRPTLDSGRRKAANRKNKTKTNAEQNRNEVEIEVECESECKGEEERKREVECEYIPPTSPLGVAEKSDADEQVTDDGFDIFWAAYPVKTGIIERAYREYLHALDSGATLPQLIAAIEQHKPMWAEQGTRYTPSAEKWLHNRGWTADLETGRPDRLAWIDGVEL